MSNGYKQQGILSLVPQVFFDIIARIIPGFVILNVFLIVYFHFDEYGKFIERLFGISSGDYKLESPVLFFIVTIAYSYALGVLLWGIRYGANCLIYKDKVVELETGIKFKDQSMIDQYSKDYCTIKSKEPLAGTRLTKVKAEIHMTMSLTSGFYIACIFSLFLADYQGSSILYLYSIIFIMMIIASESAGKHFRSHMKKSIENIKEVCCL